MKQVLILGNGISRLLYEDFIQSWRGEIWGCNYIFLDYGHRLTRLAGHVDVLQKAGQWRGETGCTFEIWGGHLGGVNNEMTLFTCPPEFRKDSGTTLVAQALEEGYEKILVCGFDLGGPDIYSPDMEKKNKKCWVLRWRNLAMHYGLDRVHFVGYDHKPFILGDESETAYMRKYRFGKPHIPDPEYIKLFSKLTGYSPEEWEYEVVKVEYTTGRNKGLRTEYREEIVLKLAAKGMVRIIREPKKKGRLSKSKPPEEPREKTENGEETGE